MVLQATNVDVWGSLREEVDIVKLLLLDCEHVVHLVIRKYYVLYALHAFSRILLFYSFLFIQLSQWIHTDALLRYVA